MDVFEEALRIANEHGERLAADARRTSARKKKATPVATGGRRKDPEGRQRWLRDVVNYIELHGYSPAYGDLAALWGLSAAHSRWRVLQLVGEGWLQVDRRVARSLRVTALGRDLLGL